ncbi:MAG: hypothetical protein DRP47_09880 [Candidatus Zixiibacteriota bacterium]|nr:MAG: hypothetical protein DRP47_09880 [candidate division Zixibacteria bacterium]
MSQDIGEVAGNIWHALDEKKELPISQISKMIKAKDAITYQGLGWLAREGKLCYRTEGRRTFISLNEPALLGRPVKA